MHSGERGAFRRGQGSFRRGAYVHTYCISSPHAHMGWTYLDEANTPGYTLYVHNTGNMGKAQHVHVHVHIHMHACMRTPTLMAIWGSVLINIDSEHMSIPNNCTIILCRLCTDLIAMYNNCHFGVYRQCR